MSVRVESDGMCRAAVAEQEEPAVSRPPASPAVKGCRSRDEVEKFKAVENDRHRGVMGRALERALRTQLQGLPDGGKQEVKLSLEGAAELAVSGKAKFTVAREGDRYLVTVHGGGAVGVGAKVGVAEAKATAGLEGTAVFRFGSPEEAADAMTAMAQVAPLAAGGPAALPALLLADKDAVSRAGHFVKRMQSVELGATAAVEAEVSAPIQELEAKLGVELKGASGLKLDLEKGELVYSRSLEAKLEGSASEALIPGKLKQSSAVAELRGQVVLETHFPVSPQDLKRIQQEGMGAIKQVASRGLQDARLEASLKLEGQVGGVGFVAQRNGPPGELVNALVKGDLVRGDDWSFKGFSVNAGFTAGFDAGVVEGKLSVETDLPIINGQGELVTLVHSTAKRAEEDARILEQLRSAGWRRLTFDNPKN